MKKLILSTITSLALLTLSYAGINSVTGVGEGTPWETFSDQLQKNSSVRSGFLSGLMNGPGGASYATTATAAGTTTLTNASKAVQYFTGSTTQTVTLPVASTMTVGQSFIIENLSSGAVTVQSSGSNSVVVLAANTRATIRCVTASGTGTSSWDAVPYEAAKVASGKVANISNSLTLAGTDSTTMTFPSTSATIARTDAANTFTGTQTVGALVATTVNGNTVTTGTGVLTLAAAKTLTVSNTLTLAGTDSTVMTFPSTSATIARTDAANTFTGAQTAASGFNQVYHVSIPLSAAQIIAMYTTPVQLIAAPGSGHFISVVKANFSITRTSTAFTGGGAAIIQYDSTANGAGTQACDSTLASTVITGSAGLSNSIRNGAIISDSAGLDNKGLYISNATAVFAAGTGTAVADVWYTVN